MLKNKITAALLGLALCLPVVMAPVPTAQAQDIRIYTHAPEPVDTSDPSDVPLVVLTLDLSILQLVSGGDGALDGFFGALGLGNILDLDNLLGGVNGLLQGTGIPQLTDQLGIIKLLLYPLLNQLVGLRVVIMASYSHTYEHQVCNGPLCWFKHTETETENGAAVLFTSGKDHLLGENLSGTLFTVDDLGNVGNALTNSLGAAGYSLGVPFQGVAVYEELVDYLTDTGKPSAPPLTADNATGSDGKYISPLTGTCSGTDIHVINVMLSNAAKPDAFAAKVKELAETGFTYNGGQYHIRSSYLLLGGPQAGNGLFGLLHKALGTTNTLLGLTGLGPLLGSQIKSTVYGAATTPVSNRSLAAPQPVQNRLGASTLPMYSGRFSYQPNATDRAWRGALTKLSIDPTDPSSATPTEFDMPNSVAPTNAQCTGTDCADVYYQKTNGSISALDLNDDTLKDICGSGNEGDCNNTYLTADDKLAAAKQIAWARGYQVSRDNLEESGYDYQGLLGFLNGTIGLLENVLKGTLHAVSGILSGILPGFDAGCVDKSNTGGSSCPWWNLLCHVGTVVKGIVDLLETVLSGVLGLDFSTCNIPSGTAPPAREHMGDILHSTPLAIDYGGDHGVRIFFGTNTGFLHQFNANGDAVWRFAPRVTMKHFAVWSAGNFKKAHGPYGVDGAPIAYINDANKDGKITNPETTGDSVYLYFGLRRGGKSYYALDVTNPNQKPELLWTINSKDVSGNKFSELGWTFSMPAIGQAHDANGNEVPVLVFGGGYDKQNDPPAAVGNYKAGTEDDEGTALYVVNALTGDLIQKLDPTTLVDSIPSAPTAVDTNGDGLLDTVYVGDTGGRVWRADISDANPDNWSMTAIANLGRHYTNDIANDRRFFHPPDVVRAKIDVTDINPNKTGNQPGSRMVRAIIIGSGNRAAPLKTTTSNYLYVIKDSNDITYPVTPDELCSTGTEDCNLDSAVAGWKLQLPNSGEKALSSPITFDGTVVFTTYVPSDPTASSGASCTPKEGNGRLYAIDLNDGEADDDLAWGARSKTIYPQGIPSTLQYVGSGSFLGLYDRINSKYKVLNLDSPRVWRTYWRSRQSE